MLNRAPFKPASLNWAPLSKYCLNKINKKRRAQRISVNGTFSNTFALECGVPQGSCLGPLLFTIYTSKLFEIIRSHLPSAHAYADDTQLYMSFRPSDSLSELEAATALENCILDGVLE